MFKSPPKSVEADLKEEIHLECDVDGNPLEIVWVHAPAAEVSFSFLFLFLNNKKKKKRFVIYIFSVPFG